MPITNIIDRRKRPYRFLKINAVVEAAWHDNACADADRVEGKAGPDYDHVEHVTVCFAIAWANKILDPVTLYLYDADSGIYVVDKVVQLGARRGH